MTPIAPPMPAVSPSPTSDRPHSLDRNDSTFERSDFAEPYEAAQREVDAHDSAATEPGVDESSRTDRPAGRESAASSTPKTETSGATSFDPGAEPTPLDVPETPAIESTEPPAQMLAPLPQSLVRPARAETAAGERPSVDIDMGVALDQNGPAGARPADDAAAGPRTAQAGAGHLASRPVPAPDHAPPGSMVVPSPSVPVVGDVVSMVVPSPSVPAAGDVGSTVVPSPSVPTVGEAGSTVVPSPSVPAARDVGSTVPSPSASTAGEAGSTVVPSASAPVDGDVGSTVPSPSAPVADPMLSPPDRASSAAAPSPSVSAVPTVDVASTDAAFATPDAGRETGAAALSDRPAHVARARTASPSPGLPNDAPPSRLGVAPVVEPAADAPSPGETAPASPSTAEPTVVGRPLEADAALDESARPASSGPAPASAADDAGAVVGGPAGQRSGVARSTGALDGQRLATPSPSSTMNADVPRDVLADSELRRAANGAMRLGLDVATDELGSIRVNALERSGGLHVSLAADRRATQAVLEGELQTLRQELNDSSGSDVRVDLGVADDRTGRRAPNLSDPERSGSEPVRDATDDHADDSADDPIVPAGVTHPRSQVDLRL